MYRFLSIEWTLWLVGWIIASFELDIGWLPLTPQNSSSCVKLAVFEDRFGGVSTILGVRGLHSSFYCNQTIITCGSWNSER